MTDRIAEIRERLEKATPEPWGWWDYGLRQGGKGPYVIDERYLPEMDRDTPDLSFIAHARADIPYLLDRLEAAEEALQPYEEYTGSWRCPICRQWGAELQYVHHRKDCKAAAALKEAL